MDLFVSSTIFKNINDVVDWANANACNIEISRFGKLSTIDSNFKNTIKTYKDALKDFDGQLSMHGFFFDLNPSSTDPQIKAVTELRYNMIFEAAAELNAKTIVFHTGFNSSIKHHAYYPEFVENQIEFWQSFIKNFEQANITAALENTLELSPEVILEVLDNVKSPKLKACLDVGHANIMSDMSIVEWINAFGKNLVHMHLHNNYGQEDEHNSVLKGTLNFEEIFAALQKNKLNPDLIFEIFKAEEALKSMDFCKQALAKRFAHSAA